MIKIDTGIAFQIGSLTIRWYSIMIVLGIIVALLIVARNCKKKNIDLDHVLDIAILLIPSGIIGARIYYVIFDWNYYSQHPEYIFATWKGGLAIHGCIIGGAIALAIYCHIKKHPFRIWGDIITPGLILAQAIGRWGNFFNQEAYGYETNLPWGMYIDGAMRHPTFLYESIWNVIGFIILFTLWEKWHKRKDGDIMACYFIFYSLGRFVVESFRTDSLMLGDFRVAMLISLAGVALGVFTLWYNRHHPVTAEIKPLPPAEPKPKKTKKQKNKH